MTQKDIGGLITFGKRYSAGSVLFLAGEAEDEADLDGGTPIQKAAPDAGRLKRVRGLLAEQFKAEKITPEEGKKQMARAEKMTGDELKNFEIELKKFFTQGIYLQTTFKATWDEAGSNWPRLSSQMSGAASRQVGQFLKL